MPPVPPLSTRLALTIAGSDSIAGAGIQADLKTFAAFGIYGVSVITAVTSQNTLGVSDVFPVSPEVVKSQIEQVSQDVEISAVKTGMLATSETVTLVADAIDRFGLLNVVIDPVMAATAGARTLLAPEAVSILKTRLLPIASVVTPNVDEARALSGIRVDSQDSAREAANRISDLGPAAVIIKGGHLDGHHATDILLHAGKFTELTAPRFNLGSIHGTGCTFASAIAAGLALGDNIPDAVHRAKDYVTGAIHHSLEIGHGARVLNHFWW